MRALRFHGKQDVRVEDVDPPTPGPGQVRLRNGYAGICGSDLHVYYDPANAGLDFEHPHPITGSMPPQILGHEFSGEVVELGEGVDGLEVGDRVAVWPIYSCGECAACRAGRPNACVTIGFHGLTSDGGGMAEYTTVDASMLHRLPDGVDLRFGALVEPMAVAWRAVELSEVAPGGSAVVLGAGPIGIGAWYALRAKGVEPIVVSEPSPRRREAIAALGAEHLVDPTEQDLAEVVADLTGGDGADAVIDAAGVGVAVLQGIQALRPAGTFVVVALHEKGVEFNPTMLVMGEKRMVGSLAYLHEDFDAVIAAMADGLYDLTGWVEIVGLDEVEDAIGRLRAGDGLKILVEAR
ncbi:2,3-butanediol dehydrogenase [Nitriliruptoraceae bacterium ZYF776]|nr:2,3-butanediol dehydrogenase [Profundirhabdus halotolerans]